MQTRLADWIRDTPAGVEADAILRKCVHCGFCLATCPTYTLLGDELDSPRGRIYLIKNMLEEGGPEGVKTIGEETVKHIDRCLSCLACMTTCPSGVHYMHLVDHGRRHIEAHYRRPWAERLLRHWPGSSSAWCGAFRWRRRAAPNWACTSRGRSMRRGFSIGAAGSSGLLSRNRAMPAQR